eukprot:scaffold10898_cov128-Isochrysis_galbana.AAC.4
MAVGVYKPPHAPERGMGRPPHGSGIIVWGLKQPPVNDVMIDSPTDTSLTKGRERSAPGMSHADTHTPLHGLTGGVPSHKHSFGEEGRQP